MPPPSAGESMLTSRVVLRDGSTAGVRLSAPSDRDTMRAFFAHLSPESLRLRFCGMTRVTDSFIERLCDNSDLRNQATLVICRHDGPHLRFIGVGSYFSTSAAGDSAEVAFAVDDGFHGKGIGTTLLEQLVPLGIEQGFVSFEAVVLPENHEMLDVFRHSGFQEHSSTEDGAVEVRLTLLPSEASTSAVDERDRIATIASLRPLLRPRSIAVIGVSREPSNLGRRVFDALIASEKSDGSPAIYAVNPAIDTVNGRPCVRSARDLPSGVDLAVIAVPAGAVLSVVDDCAASGVKGVVVISAGFAETGEPGRVLQQQLVENVRGHGMRLIGPNCMGLINTHAPFQFNATFAEQIPPEGNITLASQSGGLGLAILELARTRRVGLSAFVSLGNKADVSGNDILQYAEDDAATSVILLYLESMGNPRRFGRLARRISRKKPIVALKAGRTAPGRRAASSHTAGLAASDLAIDALFHQSGVIRVETIDEMFDVATCLEAQPLPRGRRVAILTNTGGPGILAADACAGAGLHVNELSDGTRSMLQRILPSAAAMSNPVDMVASAGPDQYLECLKVLLAAEEIDSVIVVYTAIDAERSPEILKAIHEGVGGGRGLGGRDKPVLLCTMASWLTQEPSVGDEVIPVYPFVEAAAKALGKATTYAEWRSEPKHSTPVFHEIDVKKIRSFCRQILEERGETWLTLEELRRLLRMSGIAGPGGMVARTADEAVEAARRTGFPVAAKIVSPLAIHKTDIGGVRVNLTSDDGVRAAFTDMTASTRAQIGTIPDGVLIQPMVAGIETFVGLTEDGLFGPLVGFGLGGVSVELFRDVAFRIAPLTDKDADELLHGIRGSALLEGYRGRPGADLNALRDLLFKVSHLGDRIPEVIELDLNPVMAHGPGQGCTIVDARIKVGRLQARPFPE